MSTYDDLFMPNDKFYKQFMLKKAYEADVFDLMTIVNSLSFLKQEDETLQILHEAWLQATGSRMANTDLGDLVQAEKMDDHVDKIALATMRIIKGNVVCSKEQALELQVEMQKSAEGKSLKARVSSV